MQILFVSADIPSRRQIRAHGILSALAGRGHEITVVCGTASDDRRHVSELRSRGLRVVAVPQPAAARRWNTLRAMAGPLPARAAAAFGERLLAAVSGEARGGAYDVAHVDGIAASALGFALIGLPAVLDAATCVSLALAHGASTSWRRTARIAPDLARARRHEAAYSQSYDRVVAASADDAWALGALRNPSDNPSPAIHVVPTPLAQERVPGLLTLRDQSALMLCAAPEGRDDSIRAMVN